jgi:hypothetical protein
LCVCTFFKRFLTFNHSAYCCRAHEKTLIASAATLGAKSGTGLARKVKTYIEASPHPEAVVMMRKTGALRTALYREKKKVMGWKQTIPTSPKGTCMYS